MQRSIEVHSGSQMLMGFVPFISYALTYLLTEVFLFPCRSVISQPARTKESCISGWPLPCLPWHGAQLKVSFSRYLLPYTYYSLINFNHNFQGFWVGIWFFIFKFQYYVVIKTAFTETLLLSSSSKDRMRPTYNCCSLSLSTSFFFDKVRNIIM